MGGLSRLLAEMASVDSIKGATIKRPNRTSYRPKSARK